MGKRYIPLLFATLLGATACASDQVSGPATTADPPTTGTPITETPTTTRELDIDARAYYDDYEESQGDMATAGAPPVAPSASTGGAADASEAADVIAPEPPQEPGPLEDNVFVDDGDSTFVATSDDAESTFGLDVDTGSFTVGRTFLDNGYLPEPDSIRPEEWVTSTAIPSRPMATWA